MTLKEAGIYAERNLSLKEKGVKYTADLAVPLGDDKWLPVMLTSSEEPASASNILHLSPNSQTTDCLKIVQQALAKLQE